MTRVASALHVFTTKPEQDVTSLDPGRMHQGDCEENRSCAQQQMSQTYAQRMYGNSTECVESTVSAMRMMKACMTYRGQIIRTAIGQGA